MYTLDLQNFSGLRQLLRQQPGSEVVLEKVSFQTLLLIQFAQLLIAPGINAVFAFGEEWGWRGFLLSKLLPLGQWRALGLSGALWGLWHMPVILLGYNYPLHPQFGVLLMMIFCVIMGVLSRLDAISDREHLARCHRPWRAERGWRIWLCICQCGRRRSIQLKSRFWVGPDGFCPC